MDVLFSFEFTTFSTSFSVTGSKKNNFFEGSLIVSRIEPFIFAIFLASFRPTLTKKKIKHVSYRFTHLIYFAIIIKHSLWSY